MRSVSAFKTANDEKYELWIFDKGACFRITADFSQLLEPIRCHAGLTVGGGACLRATHIGSVQLDMEIGGSVLSVTLSDVLYVPDWNEACMISWRMRDLLRHFRMVGDHSMITVQCKSDPSPVFSAEVIHACYQVLPLARHNEIYTAATHFWEQPLVHASTCFCSTATHIYGDASILPKRTTEFFCPACPQCHCKHCIALPVSNPQCKIPFDLIHSDLLVPRSVESLVRRKYMLTFVEDNMSYAHVHFLH